MGKKSKLSYVYPTEDGNANELSFFKLNFSGVNTPIPKMKIAYKEPMASASLYFKVKFLNSMALPRTDGNESNHRNIDIFKYVFS